MRTGMDDDVRFGTKPNQPFNNEVKTYFLNEEELLQYRHGEPMTALGKAKRLIKTTNLYPSEIVQATGAPIEGVDALYINKAYEAKKRAFN